MEAAKDAVIVLDGLRKQRNINDYIGDSLSDAVLASCVEEAEHLLAHTHCWLRANHPELLGEA